MRSAISIPTNGEDRSAEDRVHAGFVELVDLVQVVEGLEGRRFQAGLLAQLAQGAADDPLARLE